MIKLYHFMLIFIKCNKKSLSNNRRGYFILYKIMRKKT